MTKEGIAKLIRAQIRARFAGFGFFANRLRPKGYVNLRKTKPASRSSNLRREASFATPSKFPKRGEVHWVNLDPTVGTEVNKRRPCLIVSNDAMNEASRRVIVAPITSSVKHVYPFEVKVEVQGKHGKALLDQVRAIDKLRLCGRIVYMEKEVMDLVDKALKISFGLT